MLNPITGLWEDDSHPDGGILGDQAAAPVNPGPMPPPVSQAPGPEAPSPLPNGAPILDAGPPAAPPPAPGLATGAPPIPNVAPVAPIAVPPIPAGRVVSPAEAANLGAIDQTTAGRVQTAQQQGQVNTAAAQAKAESADAGLAEQQQFAAERQKIADDAANRIKQRTAQADADFAQYKNFGLHDPEADKSFARKLLEGIASAMGAYASGINGGPNQALSIIQNANKENIDRQKAQQEKLFQIAQRSGKDVEAAQQDRDDAFKQLDLKHSALLESSAAALRAQMAKLGVPQAQIDANGDIQKLEGDALGLREKTLTSIRNDETALAKADIDAAAKRAKAARSGAGGAGGPGGSSWMDAMKAAAQQPGATPMSVAAAAQGAGYRGKLTTLIASARGEIADAEKQTGAVGKQMDDFEKQLNGSGGKMGPAAQLTRLTAMRSELGQAIASGDAGRAKAAITAITEEAGGMLSGGKTTKFTSTLLEGLKSTGDEFREHFAKIIGDPAAGQTFKANLDKLLAGVANEKRSEIDEIRSNAVNQTMGAGGTAATPAAKRLAMSRFAGITGSIKDEQGNPVYDEGGKKPGAPASAGAPAQVTPDAKRAAAQRVINDPNAPAPARQRALLYMRTGQ